MYIHIRYGIERESHILELGGGIVCVVDVLERIREVKAIKYSTLLLLDQHNEILSSNHYIHKAQYYRVIRKPPRNNRHCLDNIKKTIDIV